MFFLSLLQLCRFGLVVSINFIRENAVSKCFYVAINSRIRIHANFLARFKVAIGMFSSLVLKLRRLMGHYLNLVNVR